MGVAATVFAAVVAVGTTGVKIDNQSKTLSVRAAAAADLSAKNVDVARTRAEKRARALAGERLRAALELLGVDKTEAAAAAEKYEVKKIDYMTDGAVVLEAELAAAPWLKAGKKGSSQ